MKSLTFLFSIYAINLYFAQNGKTFSRLLEPQNVAQMPNVAEKLPPTIGLNGNDKGSNDLHVIQIYNKVSTRL